MYHIIPIPAQITIFAIEIFICFLPHKSCGLVDAVGIMRYNSIPYIQPSSAATVPGYLRSSSPRSSPPLVAVPYYCHPSDPVSKYGPRDFLVQVQSRQCHARMLCADSSWAEIEGWNLQMNTCSSLRVRVRVLYLNVVVVSFGRDR